jgi:CheY-like chemotaxis protein
MERLPGLMQYKLTPDKRVPMGTIPPSSHVPQVFLYADDDTAQLTLKRALFELWGYEVLTAVSGEHACEVFDKHTIDIVVLDYKMSPMDGGEAACAIRRAYPTIPIILYTAELDVPRHALRCVSRLVRKSESPDVLRAALDEFVSPKSN